jgi:predicted 2-oxoglutarate/Fe(II)-dependent dioxygenase YbiX
VSNPRFAFDTAAGRYLVLAFLHDMTDPANAARVRAVQERADLFDDRTASCFALSTAPGDEAEGRLANRIPGFRVIWDHDLSVSRLYGAAGADGARRGLWVLIDPTLRVIAAIPFAADGRDAAALLSVLDRQPPPDRFAGIPLQAPILYLPRVFEPALCQQLIAIYERQGGEISGFMREVDGRTVGQHDPRHKVRRDTVIEDPALIRAVQARILRRVVPEIAKVHQFRATRMERYIVSCYDAAEAGHFTAHRDNTTPGTAHRRFAVSINLNDGFAGGEVSFPEYGPQGFTAPPGGAVVFSCSLLHKVSRVTHGRRYAFLPFLYDDAAAALRTANRAREAAAQGTG